MISDRTNIPDGAIETLREHHPVGKLLADETDEADNLGRILNHAHGERVRSDYDLDDEVTDEEAKEAAANAIHFVDECAKRRDLKSLPDSRGRI